MGEWGSDTPLPLHLSGWGWGGGVVSVLVEYDRPLPRQNGSDSSTIEATFDYCLFNEPPERTVAVLKGLTTPVM